MTEVEERAQVSSAISSLLPEHCRAGRGLLRWTQAKLAERAGVSRSTIRDFEAGRHALHRATEAQIAQTLEAAGVRLLPASSEGPGVRLQFFEAR